jgi:long-chain fatty acid transport protein
MLGALVLAAGEAHAGPLDFLGYDAETGAVANSSLSFGRSLGVMPLNPALLPMVENEVYFGTMLISPQLHIELMPKPSSTNVPISIYSSNLGITPGLQNRSQPTVELQNPRSNTDITAVQSLVGIGFAYDFGIKRLKFGAFAVLPTSGGGAANIETHYDDEREAEFSDQVHFLRFGEWDQVLDVTAGAGYELTRWLNVGVAAEIAAAAVANINVYVPNAAVQSYTTSDLGAQIAVRLRPIIGLRATPTDWLGFGLVWRNESYFSVNAQSNVTLWDSNEPDPTKTIVQHSTESFPADFDYHPMEVAIGAGVRKGPFTAQVTGTWQRWSHYVDEHGGTPQTDAAFPPSPFPSAPIDTAKYGFSDTMSVQAGVNWQLSKVIEASVGGAYYPSPVPPQLGRTNFADGNILGVTTGQRYDFEVFHRRFAVAVCAQLWHMLPTTTYKDPTQIVDEFPDGSRTLMGNNSIPEAQGLQTNNPGFPGYTAGGYLFAGSVSLHHAF